jgi:hypothetical protein
VRTEEQNTNTIGLIVLLFVISFLKDDITPDFLNTPKALFLKDAPIRLFTLFSNPVFWILAIGYSVLFTVLPYFIMQIACSEQYAKYVLIILASIAVSEYVMIWANYQVLDHYIIPKVNRFYHSPLFTLFFFAAYTINRRMTNVR